MTEMEARIRIAYSTDWATLVHEVNDANIPSHAKISVYEMKSGSPVEPGYTDLVFRWTK